LPKQRITGVPDANGVRLSPARAKNGHSVTPETEAGGIEKTRHIFSSGHTRISISAADSNRIETGALAESRFHNTSFKRTGCYSAFNNLNGVRCSALLITIVQ